jgi:hypothetical protein
MVSIRFTAPLWFEIARGCNPDVARDEESL